MEDRFRDILQDALGREGLSPSDLSREVGMDKAYFVDLLAGRKKTVSVLAFMLASRRLGLDPWELAGVERPTARAEGYVGVEKVSVATAPPHAERVKGFGVVEEGAFRMGGRSEERTFVPVDGYPVARQSVFEVRGHDYVPWGLPSGSVVHAVSFGRYEAVGGPGRLVVASRREGSLVETVLRRIAVDADGEMRLLAPSGSGAASGEDGRIIDGLVAQTALPAVAP
ncbi:hypothetical protein OIU34_22115 [Pararhizobium sp. BT-229]|uniref:hypothetical protein n=1 Tax=Pararhizobium sp. BT-229 TaxID=2986923 RepID=UPI0021F6EAF0|nr:hypothetical protein [Pararhizobium sp. BT-229]MCV9964589.1 hypothetical protein [Pararhizobium sp. BT-229]